MEFELGLLGIVVIGSVVFLSRRTRKPLPLVKYDRKVREKLEQKWLECSILSSSGDEWM